jgi:inner membrane transporter RhtA
VPDPVALAGMAFVVAAGVGAERTGARHHAPQPGQASLEPAIC